MIPHLARPLMAVRMKDRYGKVKVPFPLWKEGVDSQTAVKCAGNVIEDAYTPRCWDMMHELVDEHNSIKLLLARGPHVGPEDGTIMST